MNYDDFLIEWNSEKSYFKATTSGSTGKPKSIKITKDFAIKSAQRTNRFFGINSFSHLYSCISPDFIGGKMVLVRALEASCRFSYENPSNKPLNDVNEKEIIDLISVVPSQMLHLIEKKSELPIIKNFLIGGSSIDKRLKSKIVKAEFNAYESYGMTETSSHIALRKISEVPSIPFQTFEGIKVSKDSRDCLEIKFDTGEIFITNDICEVISDREFFIKGRYDNIIISGGKKINPEEIENKISNLINLPFLISSMSDEKWGEKIILLIEKTDEASEINFSEDRNFFHELSKILLPHEMPKEIVLVSSLPKTSNGKLIRKNFRSQK